MEFKIKDRVTFPDIDFLSEGYILKIIPHLGYIVKLDKKAPNTYAYETDEILVFADMIKLVEKGD